MKISDAGLQLIMSFEGCRLEAYLDAANIWTIGYGHTGSDVHRGLKISDDHAEELLREDLAQAEAAVNKLVTMPLTRDQFDALVSLAFNIGLNALRRSTLLRKINDGDYEGAVREFSRWIYAGGRILPGLVKRRDDEAKLFRGGQGV